MKFAQKIETLRLAKGYTQEEIARMIHVSQPSYWAYEAGKSKPHMNTMIQLANVLGVGVADLRDDEPVNLEENGENETLLDIE